MTDNSSSEHVFTKGDLLYHYQTLESFAAQLPDVSELSTVQQIEFLASMLESYLRSKDHTCDNHEHCHDKHIDHSNENTCDSHVDHENTQENCHHHSNHMLSISEAWKKVYGTELEYMKYRESILNSYTPLFPELYDINHWPIEPKLKSLISQHPVYKSFESDQLIAKGVDGHPTLKLLPTSKIGVFSEKDEETLALEHKILECLTEVCPNVYVFDFLEPSFCEKIIQEIEYFEQWCIKKEIRVHRPNSMNNYGAILDDFGFESVLSHIVARYMNVLSDILYPYIGPTLDHHHGFVVSYEIGKDEDLDLHVDDSEVTLNLSLGRNFVGGDLFFAGIRCNHHQSGTGLLSGESYQLSHTIGKACIHVGRHRHAATKISSGDRKNLILWCRSSTFRKFASMLNCPEWCPIIEDEEINE